ncbi:MAG: Gfo/Idh/MocA family oxidoreductase, partial [Verrucomicrobia bacterium]|nr:Gfo/Idh/MocA family oxidoreductase [Verrucomicrobiota bacterium]
MKDRSQKPFSSDSETSPTLSRRRFVGGAMAAAGAPLLGATGGLAQEKPAEPKPTFARKIKLGVVGGGGRGKWITGLFHKHGGYEIHAVADYFQEVADAAGDQFGVDKARRFSGLSGYKRVIESGIEAIALETPPYFFPEHAQAAVEAGLHVYMAKPVAVDVPGCMTIAKAAKKATAAKRCFLVDYQMPTDPINMDVAKRIRDGGLGKLGYVLSYGFCGAFPDPPRGKTIENRLRSLIWVNDAAIGGDYIVNFDIHAIDAALWVLGKRPVAASGHSRILRPDPHSDGRDVCSVLYEFADGLVMNHQGQGLRNNSDGRLTCEFYGLQANATICY